MTNFKEAYQNLLNDLKTQEEDSLERGDTKLVDTVWSARMAIIYLTEYIDTYTQALEEAAKDSINRKRNRSQSK